MSAQIAMLSGNRLHLNHGPIDLVIAARGEAQEIERAYGAAAAVFPSILPELVAELPLLRTPLGAFARSPSPLSLSREGEALQCTEDRERTPSTGTGEGIEARLSSGTRPAANGSIARHMIEATWPYRGVYITPMAAVAGAVAEYVLAAMLQSAPGLRRAVVNNGGDIAIHLAPGESLRAGIVGDLALPGLDATFGIDHADPVHGIATSGWRGRSQSLGIADSVTVLARAASHADAAATMIANAVDVDDLGIVRVPANQVRDDSDLGILPVTVAVGTLSSDKIALALENGARRAEELRQRGLIVATCLQLQGQMRVVGELKQIAAVRAA